MLTLNGIHLILSVEAGVTNGKKREFQKNPFAEVWYACTEYARRGTNVNGNVYSNYLAEFMGHRPTFIEIKAFVLYHNNTVCL